MRSQLRIVVGILLLTASFSPPLVQAQVRSFSPAQRGSPTIEALSAAEVPPSLRVSEAGAPARLPHKLAGRFAAQDELEVVVQLQAPPLAVFAAQQRERLGVQLSSTTQAAYAAQLTSQQNAFLAAAARLGAKEEARLTKALNAVVVRIPAQQLEALARLPGVKSVRPVRHYERDLSETVPYIGASFVHNTLGITGTGVTVAVLDSGIDYTHANLGGPGTAAAFRAAWGTHITSTENTTVTASTGFPTAKVIGGYDFVGELWPTYGPRSEDPNPIDAPPGPAPAAGGHGTHVADIIAGQNVSDTHRGVAPGAKLYAVKVCSAVSPSCNGIALLKGVDYALDPNGDNDLSDAVDIINMSLGASYGQKEDDLSEAAANAVRAGVVVVASAGNSADRPYIVGSPSSAPEVVSVAQTQVPSARTYPLVINAPITIAGSYSNTATVEWAPIVNGFTGQIAYVGRGCPATGTTPADPYLDNPAGKVALIDRGACAVSLKVDRAAKAGAIGVLIANNVPGDPPTFSFGGGDTMTETLIIRLNEGNLIKTQIPTNIVTVTVSPLITVPMVGSMVASSSRGPNISFSAIKPDIGAPGASVSAVSGSGTGVRAFGGTSGAAPMVAGAAALLLSAEPNLTPAEVKARLMNTAERNVFINPATQPGVLAEISRIGGGEVRADRALGSTTAAWAANPQILNGEPYTDGVSLSLGYHRLLTGTHIFTRSVVVRNYSNLTRTYSITPTFRYADDALSGAVIPSVQPTLSVPANGSAQFVITWTVNAGALPLWNFPPSLMGTGSQLRNFEFDGYLLIGDVTDTVALPWHILPHRAAGILTPTVTSAVVTTTTPIAAVLSNPQGARTGRVDAFALTAISPLSYTNLPGRGDNRATPDLRYVGVRGVNLGGGEFGIQFAVNTWQPRTHPNYPLEIDIYVDVDRDGDDDYVIYNAEQTGFAATGVNLVFAGPLPNGPFQALFYTDADFNSGNTILTIRADQIGLSVTNPSAWQPFDFQVLACDNYFTGLCTDDTPYMTFNPAYPRAAVSGFSPNPVPVGATSTLTITPFAYNDMDSPSQQGILLLYRDAQHGREADIITLDFPSVVLTKTVGLSPSACATTKEITVTFGTTVYYCYTVRNTGNLTLTTHTLSDTVLGVLLNNYPYDLAPGETVIVTASLTPSQTTVNVAEWIAFVNGGNLPAYAADAARVNVYTPTLASLALSVTPSTLFANGISTTTVVATVRDQFNFPLPGQSVTLLTSQGTLSASGGTSDASGRVTVTLTAPKTAGVGTIFAVAGALTATRQVTFVQQITDTVNFSLSTLAQSAGAVRSGDIITYTFTVTNSGPGDATNVLMVAPIPNGTTYVADSASGGVPVGSSLTALLSGQATFAPAAGSSATAIVWQGNIPANASHTIIYAVRATLFSGVITNTSRIYLNNQLVGALTQTATVEPRSQVFVPIVQKP